jgi:phosphohistidine swiveling domain-containing protein/DNA-binding Xre family transcriptional regulator
MLYIAYLTRHMAKLKIAELAKKLRKTGLEMAADTGLNRNTIGALLRGEADGIRLSTLESISHAYRVPLSELVELDIPEPKKEASIVYPKQVYKQEGNIVPYTAWPWSLSAGTYRLLHQGAEYGYGILNAFYKGDYGEIYWNTESLRSLATAFYAEYANSPAYENLYHKYLGHASDIEQLYLETQQITPASLDAAKFNALFEKVRALYDAFWSTSLFIDAFDIGVDHEKIEEIAKQHSFTKEEIQILTTPTEPTFADERKYALLSLIKKLMSSRTTIAEKSVDEFVHKNAAKIDQYRAAFDYYRSNYAYINHISVADVKEEILHYTRDKKLFAEEFDQLDTYAVKKTRAVNAVLHAHKLTTNPLFFFQRLTYWREHRKKVNLMGFHILEAVLQSIALHTGIPRNHLQYLSFDEVENVQKGLIPPSVLERRATEGVMVAVEDGHYKMYEGKEAVSIRTGFEAILAGGVSKTLTGQTASQGFAKGIARIILSQKEFDQFKEGEILVTGMTRPEFVPLMKKAAAIVTNEGGITCHAAIVSRELGKPCVIGTKNATQVIKTGDLVEVRANHGTVRIL